MREEGLRKRVYLFILVLLTIMVPLLVIMVSTGIINGSDHSTEINFMAADEISPLYPPISLEETGSLISLEEVEKLLGVRLLPSYLPSGTMLYQVRVKGEDVTLFFENPKLRRLPFFEEDVEIILSVSKRPLPQPAKFTLVTLTYTIFEKGSAATTTITRPAPDLWSSLLHKIEVNGNPRYAAEPVGDFPAIVIWHGGNYTYTLRAYLPTEELLKITKSISMEAPSGS